MDFFNGLDNFTKIEILYNRSRFRNSIRGLAAKLLMFVRILTCAKLIVVNYKL